MKYTPTAVAGAQIVELELREDERGFFARTFDTTEFAAHGLDAAVAQGNLSFNHRAGTLRGLHRQVPPHAEGKLVRCTRARSWTSRWTSGPGRRPSVRTSWSN